MITNELINTEIKKKFKNVDYKCVTDAMLQYDNIKFKDVVLNGELRFRSFEQNFENVYTIDDGKNILAMSDSLPLPGYVFETHMMCHNEENGGMALFITLKDEYNLSDYFIRQDYVPLSVISNIEKALKEKNLSLDEEMECMFSIYLDEFKEYNSYSEFESEVKGIVKDLGIHYDNKMENDSFQELEYETYKNFLKDVNKYSKEDLLLFLNSELESF